jgi:hypothetical protein
MITTDELQFLPSFLELLIKENKISCEDLNKRFFPEDSQDNWAQELFNQVVSIYNPFLHTFKA